MIINRKSGLREVIIGYNNCVFEIDVDNSCIYISDVGKVYKDSDIVEPFDKENDRTILLDFYSKSSVDKMIYFLELIKEKM